MSSKDYIIVKDGEMVHFKYIKREKVNGEWRYYYDKGSIGRSIKKAVGIDARNAYRSARDASAAAEQEHATAYANKQKETAEAKATKSEADAARKENLTIKVTTGYRSYNFQLTLYNNYVKRDGATAADRYSARAGHSEHQTGLAFDINKANSSFAGSPEAVWLAANCYKYGFIIRYPEGKESITGYIYEPWHVRYLGVETATAVFNSGLCLEEYLVITSKYQ